jgi:hypothetical protein
MTAPPNNRMQATACAVAMGDKATHGTGAHRA